MAIPTMTARADLPRDMDLGMAIDASYSLSDIVDALDDDLAVAVSNFESPSDLFQDCWDNDECERLDQALARIRSGW